MRIRLLVAASSVLTLGWCCKHGLVPACTEIMHNSKCCLEKGSIAAAWTACGYRRTSFSTDEHPSVAFADRCFVNGQLHLICCSCDLQLFPMPSLRHCAVSACLSLQHCLSAGSGLPVVAASTAPPAIRMKAAAKSRIWLVLQDILTGWSEMHLRHQRNMWQI